MIERMSTLEITEHLERRVRQLAQERYDRIHDAVLSNGIEKGKNLVGDVARAKRENNPPYWYEDAPLREHMEKLLRIATGNKNTPEEDEYAAMLRRFDEFEGLPVGWENGTN